jgi:DNA polymerase
MTYGRDEMLKEMGLTPVWRLRERDAASTAAAAPGRENVSTPTPAARETASTMPHDDRRGAIMRMDWTELKAAVAQCRACPLHARRTNTVFGVGDENADWVFVG